MTKKSPAKTAAKPAAAKPAAPVAEATTTEKLGKTQLIDLVATQTSLTKKEAGAAVDAALEAIVEALRGGKSVGLPGVGTFSVKATAARQGVRPGTSEKIQIPAGKKVSYKVASTLKADL
ncbi:HU family DNA-binding protein (plasmid) [Deinococcus sp. KNUC1210]|uniref:HU family DNA-binding protein n=1 Tax=Deinococcus sp. KNUC1210 TaxID=2917691 RepID=UPI001EF0F992|nr:HU family DNA-binding protein [Deinococcus sp. KNUC1210]ULH14218.1 HU family DNA-binding protein [Deinococcus sp. KNUC1210]